MTKPHDRLFSEAATSFSVELVRPSENSVVDARVYREVVACVHGYIEGHARDQALLPASVEDYVAADNPVRFIDAFVDDLDLGSAGFQPIA